MSDGISLSHATGLLSTRPDAYAASQRFGRVFFAEFSGKVNLIVFLVI